MGESDQKSPQCLRTDEKQLWELALHEKFNVIWNKELVADFDHTHLYKQILEAIE